MSASASSDPATSDPASSGLPTSGPTRDEAAGRGVAAPNAVQPGTARAGAAQSGTPADPEPPEPLPYDGVASVAVGTVLWGIAAVVLSFMVGDLRDDGHLWWLATALCGFGLGLLGLWVVIRRRHRLRSAGPGAGPDQSDQVSSRSSSAAR
ncbi:DUF2530 domain-containing protein [Frankia sp. AiPs1]|uniref:DUF2530 domain-containing protein n=1 Tax=Frankia sp. AiPa1 TaxID=573492 RepID=UPI00202B57D4|nr:DUF2530 domain-containing protein [Frankia sp. AiPa1]MCL9759712.1 DUF2530 domain-containing protein [Frankia sp. AiPa1]